MGKKQEGKKREKRLYERLFIPDEIARVDDGECWKVAKISETACTRTIILRIMYM